MTFLEMLEGFLGAKGLPVDIGLFPERGCDKLPLLDSEQATDAELHGHGLGSGFSENIRLLECK